MVVIDLGAESDRTSVRPLEVNRGLPKASEECYPNKKFKAQGNHGGLPLQRN